jgi:hypothetical protein
MVHNVLADVLAGPWQYHPRKVVLDPLGGPHPLVVENTLEHSPNRIAV